ncbi:serine hydrolase [Actinophytocola sp. KF-1]
MLNFAARRVTLLAVLAATTVMTGSGCGARPTASVGEHVILAAPAPAPDAVPTPLPPPRQTATPTPDPRPAGKPQLDPKPVLAAATSVEPNTTLGAVVYDRVTDTTLLSVDADRQFRSASLVKLMIAIDMLDRGATESERRQISRMLSVSDDDIASELWVRGGPDLVPRVVTLAGLRNTEAPELAGKWGEVKVTPADVVRVYRYVMDRMPPEDRALVVDALAEAPEYAADDFDQYFGIPDGLAAQWAVKQGWGNNDHAMVLHSTGLVGEGWRYVVVLLTEHPLGSGWRTSADSVTAAARELDGRLPAA